LETEHGQWGLEHGKVAQVARQVTLLGKVELTYLVKFLLSWRKSFN
jgi:hypothetical protein